MQMQHCAFLLAVAILFSIFFTFNVSAQENGHFDTNHSDYGRDTDTPPDGLFNFLTVNVSLTITYEGRFLVQGALYAPDDTYITYATWSGQLTNGSKIVKLDFDGVEIAMSEKSGPYRVNLTLMDSMFNPLDFDTYYTSSYDVSEFQISVAMLYPPHDDTGIDLDSNGKFDILAVDVQIKANVTCSVKLDALLLDSTGTEGIESKILTRDFNAGVHVVRVNFTGYLIRMGSYDGPYQVRLKLYNSGNTLLSEDTHITDPYVSTDFEEPPATIDTPLTDFGLDLDANSLFDYLIVILQVTVTKPGFYTIEGELEENSPTATPIADTRNETHLSTGINSVWLHFLGNTVREAAINGKYKGFSQITDSNGTVCSYLSYITVTNFRYADFDTLPAFFSPPHNDTGLDTNTNGMYDYLIINASFSVRLTFTYIVKAPLWNSARTVVIDEVTETTTLISGSPFLSLWYDGRTIYNSTFPGPYFVRFYLYDPFTNLLNMSSHNTFAYQLSSFEHPAPPDTTPPTISSVTDLPDPQQVGLAVNISATVTDNIGVKNVHCNVTDPIGQMTGNFSMSYNITANRYYLTRPYTILGMHTYQLWASDVAGNSATVSNTFTIIDNIRPTINDLRIDPKPQEVFGNVNVSAIVEDNHVIDGVWLDVSPFGNLSMTIDLPSGRYFYVLSISTIGTFPFTLWAIDVAGNANSSSDALIFADSVPPLIQDLTVLPREQQPGFPVNISAYIVDNYLLSWTNIKVFNPGGSSIVDRALTYDPASSRYFHSMSYVDLGTYTFNITAGDSGGLISEAVGDFNITTSVSDTTPPSINSHSASPDPQEVYLLLRISANVTDNVAVALVKAHIHSPTGVNLGNTTMSFDGVDYYRDGTYDELGTFQYCIWAEDLRGNAAKACGEFMVRDSTKPVISSASADPLTQEVHLQVNVTATATDNFALQSINVEVKAPDGSSLGNNTMSFDSSTSSYWFLRSYSDLGPHSYTITAEDTSGNKAAFTGVFYIRDSIKPTADAGSDITIQVGESVTFDGSSSTDNDVIVNYTWTFMDGSNSIKLYGILAEYTFNNPGVFTVTLIVKDRAGNPDTDIMYVTVNTPPQPIAKPMPPTQLSVFPSEPNSMVLTWTAPVLREDGSWLLDLAGYDVFRSTITGPPYIKINPALVQATVYTDSGVSPGTTYYYVVRTVDTNGLESNYSSEAQGSITPKGSVAGSVTDRFNAPIPGTTIILMSGSSVLRITNTDISGQFSMSNVPVGSYIIRASCDGYYSKETNVLIEQDKTTDVNIVLDELPMSPGGGDDGLPWPLIALVVVPLILILTILLLFRRARARREEKKNKLTSSEEDPFSRENE